TICQRNRFIRMLGRRIRFDRLYQNQYSNCLTAIRPWRMQTYSEPTPQEPAATSIRTSLLDYIMLGESVLSPEHCQRLIERFEASEAVQACQHSGGHSFTQLEITTAWPDEHALLLPVFLDHFQKYQQLTGAIYWPANIAFEHLRIK